MHRRRWHFCSKQLSVHGWILTYASSDDEDDGQSSHHKSLICQVKRRALLSELPVKLTRPVQAAGWTLERQAGDYRWGAAAAAYVEEGKTATVRRQRPVRTLLCLPFFLTNLQITHHPNSSGREKENRDQYSRPTVQEVSTLGRSFPLTNSAIKNSTKGTSCHTNLSYADVATLSCIEYNLFFAQKNTVLFYWHKKSVEYQITRHQVDYSKTRTFPKSLSTALHFHSQSLLVYQLYSYM